MEPEDGRFRPTEEVDELRWLSVEDAVAVATYEHDRELVRAAADAIGGA